MPRPRAFREVRLLNGSTGDPCLVVDDQGRDNALLIDYRLGGSRSVGNLGLRSSEKDIAAERHETLNAGSVTVFDEARNRQSFHPR